MTGSLTCTVCMNNPGPGGTRCRLCGRMIPMTKREVVQALASLAEVEAYRAQVRFDGRDWQEGELAALVERERVLTERAR